MARMTGSAPFSASRSNVIDAGSQPPRRYTFVAPGFPEPQRLGLGKANSRQIRMAEHIEPIR